MILSVLLHDVAEDTDVTTDDLRREGFNERVLRALDLLTHRKGMPYLEYVEELKSDPIARRVKLADLRHNCDVSRGDSEKLREKREACYYPAIRILSED